MRFCMRLSVCLVVIQGFHHSVSSNESSGLEDRLNDIFFLSNVTLEDAKTLLDKAKEIYAAAKDLQNDSESETVQANKAATFLSKVIRDLKMGDMSFVKLFANMNCYLKEKTAMSFTAEKNTNRLSQDVEAVQATIKRRLADHYAVYDQPRLDVSRILSGNETNAEALFRKGHRVDPERFGIFFLEVFATILGLSWGIFSMITGNVPYPE